jgi:hypothetical protein
MYNRDGVDEWLVLYKTLASWAEVPHTNCILGHRAPTGNHASSHYFVLSFCTFPTDS